MDAIEAGAADGVFVNNISLSFDFIVFVSRETDKKYKI